MKRITLISFFSFLVAILIVFSASFALARNKVLSLDGDGDYVEISDAISLQLPDSLTMEAWILQRAVHSVTPFVIYKRFAYGFAVGNNTIYHFFYRDESSHVDKFIPVTIERGIWNHIAVTLDNDGTVKAYFNGSLIDTDFRVVPINITGILNIGRAPFGAYYFDGLIDELRIWNVARTQEEIQGNMDKPLENPKSELNLVGYWNFDEGTADDLSQYENNGELQGDAYIADVIYVSSEYGSPGGDGTKEDPYDTIQRGINEAGWKDIVQALPGTYTENINLRSDLILLGSGIENTTITAASGNIVTANNVHNVSFSGFTIDGQGSADNGIVCSGTTSEMEISNNIITDATTGFQCLDSVEVSIEENTIYQNITHGIYCAGTSVVKIGKNSTEANGSYGIMCEGQTNTSITENFVCQNWRGIFCGQDAVIVIEENEIQANDYAIHCVGSTQVDILSNHIANNRNGIDCHNAPKVNIAENLIHSNNWAILGYDSSYLLIARNIIKHNLEGGIYCGEYWDDSFELIIGGSLVNANYIIDNTWRAVWNRTEKVINATYNY
ncbi:right-handed parallel beta-helix repeat-containing protein [bacterium]|nr:right-handed parallel beta-helix repeat-containing protein [bacterium]